MTTTAPTAFGFGRKLLLGLACCTLAACTSSGDSTGSSTGGTGTGSGGSSTGGGTGTGGSVGTGGAVTGTGGSATGTGGNAAGTGGSAVTGTGASATGTGGSATGTGGGATGGGGGAASGSGGSGTCSAVFCDGFEGSTKLGSDWTVDNAVTGNVVEVVSTMGHTGTNSVHMKFGTPLGATFIHETKGFPAPMNSLWGRVWLLIMTPTSSTGHDVYIEASDGTMPANRGVRPLNTNAGSMEVNIDPSTMGGSGESTTSAKMALPRGTWTCFEWQIAATNGSGSVTLYMTGTQIATVAKTYIPPLVYMRVGYEHYTADQTGGEMWIDDYALGTSRITCN